jgi:hypothetical protein
MPDVSDSEGKYGAPNIAHGEVRPFKYELADQGADA